MGGGLVAFFQGAAELIVGPLGISAITLAIGCMAMAAAFHAVRWITVGETVLAGAVLFAASWIVSTLLQRAA